MPRRGHVPRRVKREVIIPAGVDHQMRIRLTGEGEPSPDGGPPGDCYCVIQVAEHPLFHRDGQDLIVRLPISYSQAALGATVEVPTLDGRGPLEVPHGTQSGDVFRLRAEACPIRAAAAKAICWSKCRSRCRKRSARGRKSCSARLAAEEHAHVTPQRKKFFEKLKEYFVPAEEAGAEEK